MNLHHCIMISLALLFKNNVNNIDLSSFEPQNKTGRRCD